MNERFLITGAYGCIGAWAVRQLLLEGAEVIGVDAGTDDRRVRALVDQAALDRATWVTADVSAPDDVARLFAYRPTHVIHLAAMQVPACAGDPVRGAQVNVVGTIALLAAAAAASLETPLVYASSAAAFAPSDGDGAPPADPGGEPQTHYGIFKLANERAARVFAADHGLSSIGLRPYVVYGPGRDQGLTSSPTLAMAAAAAGEGFVIPYTGRSEMQYAPDAAAAFVAAARSSFVGATVLNVPGVNADVSDVVREIERVVPAVAGRIEATGPSLPFPAALDSSRFADVVGDCPVTPLADGVAETIAFFRRETRPAQHRGPSGNPPGPR